MAALGAGPASASAVAAVDDDDVGLIRPVGKGTLSSDPEPVAELPGGVALLTADDGLHGPELWRTDGTAGGTAMLGDLVAGPEGADPWAFVVGDDGIAAFVAATGSLGAPELWRSDGTPTGTRRVASLTALGAVDVTSLVPWRGGYAFAYTTSDHQGRLGFADGGGSKSGKSDAAPRVSLTIKRLARGRWRVAGKVTGTKAGCAGQVRVVLGRGSRSLKTTKTKMKSCTFSTTLTTTSRSSGRWIQVRTPLALSHRVAVR